jgi:hypothetical protein
MDIGAKGHGGSLIAQAFAIDEHGINRRAQELTRCTQVVGHLQDTVFKVAHSLSKNYGSAWMHQYVPHQCK